MRAANGTSIRLDVTPFGFHAMVRRPDGVAWYVEPATRNVGESRVLSFPGGAVGAAPEPFVEKQVREAAQQVAPAADESFSTPGGVVTQRTFDLAFLTDPTYAAFVAPGAVTHATSDPLVLAAKVSLINRVNQVYNDDVAYKFLLVAGTDTKLNLLTAAEMTGTERPVWRQRVLHGRPGGRLRPAARWTATTSRSASWSAPTPSTSATSASASTAAASPASASSAARARPAAAPASRSRSVTSTRSTTWPTRWATRWVATTPSTAPRATAAAATATQRHSVEPGSGTSIRPTPASAASDNLQPHSDPYFSFRSIDQFEATTATVRATMTEQQVGQLHRPRHRRADDHLLRHGLHARPT